MPKSLPLPPRFFKCPELTPREEQYLVGKAKDSAKALVDVTRNHEGPVRWEDAGGHRGVQMYKGEARYPETVVGESITYGCGATTIRSTLEQVADFFDLSSDEKVAAFVASSSELLDAQLLYVLKDPVLLNEDHRSTNERSRASRASPSKLVHVKQVTVKWFASEMPSKLLKHRDFLTVECQSTFTDVSGRRGWVRSYHSIKLPSCPELSDYNLVRGSFYHTGYVFIESERAGFLDVIYSVQVNMKGNAKIPTPLFMTIQKKRLCSIADLPRLITRRRLGTQRFLGDLEIVPKSHRARCNLCSTKFGLITRKARCRKCGEVVCASACSTEWEVSIPGQGVRKVRVCSKCALNTGSAVLENLPASEPYSESDSVQEDDVPVMSVRAPGYQYNRKSNSVSSPRQTGEPSSDSDGDRRRRSGRREESYSNGERRSLDETYYDADPEYPRTVEIPGSNDADLSFDSGQYTNESGEQVETPSYRRRRDDRRYDPRNPDMYDHQTYGVSPPQFHDEEQRRALQRQQRALQQQRNKQQLLQRQQQQQEALMRRRQQQVQNPDDCQAELEDYMSNSEFSEFSNSIASSDTPSFLTSSVLAQHTKQMGKPGPVTQDERNAAQLAVQQRRTKGMVTSIELDLALPPSTTELRLTQLEQLQVQQWAEQEARFRDESLPSLDFEFPESLEEITVPVPRHRRSMSCESFASCSNLELPSFFRGSHSSALSQGHEVLVGGLELPRVSKARVNNSGQETVGVLDDEDGVDSFVDGLSLNLSSLLRPEDLRPTEGSIRLSLDSCGLDQNVLGDSDIVISGKFGASLSKGRTDISKTAIVKLYQRILELTGKQHELKAQPESDPDERKEIARELEVLYEKLHSEVEI
uniref:FYVE-type domain-containing protein n=1 Tax=Hyaloperonospora arabidopsidis (strain Emoy2) TaxID=559515 RepID=M4BPD1_HYAAE